MSNDTSSYLLTIEPRHTTSDNLTDSRSEERFKELLADHHIAQLGTKSCYAIAVVKIDNFKERTENLSEKDQTVILNEFTNRISNELENKTLISSPTGNCYILFKQVDCNQKTEAAMHKVCNAMTPYFCTSTGFIKLAISGGLTISQDTTIFPTEMLEGTLAAISLRRSTEQSLFFSTKTY
ncbi:hypothetical protein [Halodesulfovibrio sp.]|uniref:hypothetical protein n=1 Tax=Halodesulfovibrio sp. TaxID=1912772 RepID=UPI0025B7BE4D|nr:hypothetical protein [Halodesulfovibrio sp.]